MKGSQRAALVVVLLIISLINVLKWRKRLSSNFILFYFIFKKYIYFKYGNGENERPFEMNSSMRELQTSIEVQPKKKTRPLGLNMVLTLVKVTPI